jgi:hypothetical protein
MPQFADSGHIDVEYLYPPAKGSSFTVSTPLDAVQIHKNAQEERFEAIEKQIAAMHADSQAILLHFCAVLTLMAEMGKNLDALLAARGESE